MDPAIKEHLYSLHRRICPVEEKPFLYTPNFLGIERKIYESNWIKIDEFLLAELDKFQAELRNH